MKHLELFDSHFEDLPAKVCFPKPHSKNSIDSVRAHYADGKYGWRINREIKVFVLGNGYVGKTQMCRRLLGLPFDKNIKSTHGIQLDHIDMFMPGHHRRIRLNLWDFGGQEIYHGSHNLFLQKPAIFLLLWTPDTEQGEYIDEERTIRNHSLAYWVDLVDNIGGAECPMLIIQGRCDTDADIKSLPISLSKKTAFRHHLIFSATDDKDDKKLEALRSSIKQAANEILERYQWSTIPKGRFRLARKLRRMVENIDMRLKQNRPPRRILTQKQFQHLCEKNGEIENWRETLIFFHHSGVFFWRQDHFKGRIILDMSWAFNAVYTIFRLDSALRKFRGKGRFTLEQLAITEWRDFPASEQLTFLSIMMSCGICFPVRLKSDYFEYIAPELLPSRELSEMKGQVIGPQPKDPVLINVPYRFLHEGILRRLLSWIGVHFAEKTIYWRYGCWLHDQKNGVQAVIDSHWDNDADHPGQGVITLEIWGRDCKAFLRCILDELRRLSPTQDLNISFIGTTESEHSEASHEVSENVPLLADIDPTNTSATSRRIYTVYLIRKIFKQKEEGTSLRAVDLAEELKRQFNWEIERTTVIKHMNHVQKILGKKIGNNQLRLFETYHKIGFIMVQSTLVLNTGIEQAWQIIKSIGRRMHKHRAENGEIS